MNTLAVPTMYLTRSISEVPKSPMVKSFVSKTNGACHVGRLVKSHFETFFHPIQFLLHQDCICGGYSMKERMEEYKKSGKLLTTAPPGTTNAKKLFSPIPNLQCKHEDDDVRFVSMLIPLWPIHTDFFFKTLILNKKG